MNTKEIKKEILKSKNKIQKFVGFKSKTDDSYEDLDIMIDELISLIIKKCEEEELEFLECFDDFDYCRECHLCKNARESLNNRIKEIKKGK